MRPLGARTSVCASFASIDVAAQTEVCAPRGRPLLIALLMILSATVHADDLLTRFTPRIHTSADGNTLPYRWYVPPDASADRKVPLVILLHGTSGRGTDNERQLTAANRTAITFLLAQTAHPCAIAVPQCPPDDQWTRTTYHPERHDRTPEPGRTMRGLIDLIRTQAQETVIDAKRIYVIGNSMGGYGTWDLLSRAPELIVAAIPICGGASLDTAPAIAHIPVWTFHGAQDGIVMVGHSQRMVAALKAHGSEPRYTEFADAGHDIAERVFATTGLADWLFAQQRL
jgi:predicted peptidase